MNDTYSLLETHEAARSAYRGIIVAAPFAMAAWAVMLGGVLFLR